MNQLHSLFNSSITWKNHCSTFDKKQKSIFLLLPPFFVYAQNCFLYNTFFNPGLIFLCPRCLSVHVVELLIFSSLWAFALKTFLDLLEVGDIIFSTHKLPPNFHFHPKLLSIWTLNCWLFWFEYRDHSEIYW